MKKDKTRRHQTRQLLRRLRMLYGEQMLCHRQSKHTKHYQFVSTKGYTVRVYPQHAVVIVSDPDRTWSFTERTLFANERTLKELYAMVEHHVYLGRNPDVRDVAQGNVCRPMRDEVEEFDMSKFAIERESKKQERKQDNVNRI